MCGLTGWISTRPERFGVAAATTLAAMQAAVAHRGPDGWGAHVDPPRQGREFGVAMGFTRLAIRDLVHGDQPRLVRPTAAAGRLGACLVTSFNGELYDGAALRAALRAAGRDVRGHGDAELLAHGAAAWGDGLWPRLEGMFAAAVWQPDRATLTLARDGSGQKPLYVGLIDDGQTVLWGSELGALLAHPGLQPALDPRGVQALLWLDYVPAPGSLLRGVYKVPPGAIWTLTAPTERTPTKRTPMERNWPAHAHPETTPRIQLHTARLPPPRRAPGVEQPPAGLSFSAAVDALDRRLDRAVARRLVSDVPLGVFLSGGVDSSLVAHYAARHTSPAAGHAATSSQGAGPLQTLSIRFTEASFDEAPYAREVAAHLASRARHGRLLHHELPFSAADGLAALRALLESADEPLADPSLLVTRYLCEKARDLGLKVALGGDGGDEAWLGYPTFALHGLATALHHLPASARLAAAQLGRRLPASVHNLAAPELLRRFLDGLAGPPSVRALTWIGGLPPDQLSAVYEPDRLDAGRAAASGWDRQLGLTSPVAQWSAAATALHTSALLTDASGATARDRALHAERALLSRTYLAEGVLQKVDRASMAMGVEVRAPWLDRDVLALAAALPPTMQLRGGLRQGWGGGHGKRVPRALAARHLPARVARRGKKGFGVPLAAWFRGPFAAVVRQELRSEAVAAVPGLRAAAVAAMVERHLAGGADHRKTLFALLRLVAWWRRVQR